MFMENPTPALPSHYLGSSYDRGHLVPAAALAPRQVEDVQLDPTQGGREGVRDVQDPHPGSPASPAETSAGATPARRWASTHTSAVTPPTGISAK